MTKIQLKTTTNGFVPRDVTSLKYGVRNINIRGYWKEEIMEINIIVKDPHLYNLLNEARFKNGAIIEFVTNQVTDITYAKDISFHAFVDEFSIINVIL